MSTCVIVTDNGNIELTRRASEFLQKLLDEGATIQLDFHGVYGQVPHTLLQDQLQTLRDARAWVDRHPESSIPIGLRWFMWAQTVTPTQSPEALKRLPRQHLPQ